VSLKVVNPYNQEVVCELSYDEGTQLDAKIDAVRRAYEEWRHLSIAERSSRVAEGLRRFRTNADAIARDITLQMGKPLRQSHREIETFFQRAEYMLSIAQESLAPDILPEKEGFHRRIEHTPLGVVLCIAAWNYPLLIPVNVVVPALLAGNTVLLKHSAKTPLCGQHFEDALGGLEPLGLVKNLVLSHEQTAALIADPRVNHVNFTGSVPGGHQIYRAAAQRFLDVGLELGGKDPAYVAQDADLDFSVEHLIDGACYNAGQSCCAVERVYVHRALYREFLARAKIVMGRYRLGDPLDDDTTLGPLANRSALDMLERRVEQAVRRGARLLLGGRRLDGTSGNFFPPTLLADVPNDATLMQDETFGPLVPVLAVADDDEALARMADTRYGLTASVWTRSRDRAERFARAVEAGTIYQNRCDYLDPALPWTGTRDSGKGTTLSRYGFYQLTRRKSIHFRERV